MRAGSTSCARTSPRSTLTLTAEQLAALDEVSAPALNFPAENNRSLAPLLQFAGATVDGQAHGPSPLLAASEARY